MKIVCPNCGADYRISEGKVPPDGLVIKCPSCLTQFRAQLDGSTRLEGDMSGATEPPPPPPAVATDSPLPPPPPAALDDELDDFDLPEDFAMPELDSFDAPEFVGQGGIESAPVDRLAPPPPAGVDQAPISRVSDDDFDFNFGDSPSTTASASSGASSPLGDLFDDLDDLPAPKGETLEPHFTDLPAPRAPASNASFSEVSDLPGLKVDSLASDSPPKNAPELLLAPEDVHGAPELPNDDDAHFFAATGTQVGAQAGPAALKTSAPAKGAQSGSRKTLWIALSTMLIVGVGVGGLMIAEVGPFKSIQASKKSRKKKAVTQKKEQKKAVKTAQKKPAKPVVPDELNTVETRAPTRAEVFGFQTEIARLEPSRKTLDQVSLTALGELYAFGALEYPENAHWAKSATGVAKDLTKKEDPKTRRMTIAAELANGGSDALTKIVALSKEMPRDAKTLMLLGYARLKNGETEGAYNAFQRAYTLDKNLYDAQLRAGSLALELGQIEDARVLFEDLYKKAPGAPRVNTALAALDFRQGNHKRASKLLLQALTLKKGRARGQDRSRAFVLRARIAQSQGNDKDALSDLNSAVRVWPKNLEALDLLSAKHFEAGDFDKALSIFKELEQAGATSPQTAIKISQCFVKMGQPKRALERLTEAQKGFEKAAEIPTEIGNIHADKKDYAKAREAYDSALKTNALYEPAQLKIAELLVKQAAVDKAMVYLNAALKKNPNSALMNLGLADLQWQIAESSQEVELMAKAEKGYRKALALAPGLLNARQRLVSVLLAEGKAKDALDELKKLAKRTDFHGDMNYEFGRAKQALGRHKEATQHFEKALKIQPKNATYLEYAGVSRYALNEREAAQRLFKLTIELDPKNINAYYHLGRIAYAEKQYEHAVQRFKQALELDKLEPQNRYWLGRALEAQNAKPQRSAARQEYDRVAKQVLENESLEATLCDVFFRRAQMQKLSFSEWRAAVTEFTRYLKCNPKSAEAYLYRGQIKEKLGELDPAISDFQKASQLKKGYALAYASNAYAQLRKPKPNEKKIQALLTKAIRHDKTLAYPHYLLCNLVKDKNKGVARQHCQSYLKLAPNGEYAGMAKDLLRSL